MRKDIPQRLDRLFKKLEQKNMFEFEVFEVFDLHVNHLKSFVEFNLRQRNKSYRKQDCLLSLSTMRAIQGALGCDPRDLVFTAYDVSSDGDGSDYVGYVLAYYKLKKRKK